MSPSRWSATVTSMSPLSVGTLAWRHRDALFLTVMAKATLRIVPGGTCVFDTPEPILTADTAIDGFSIAREDAPTLGSAEVVAWGVSPPGDVEAMLVAGVGSERLIAQRQRVQGPAVTCFGPIVKDRRGGFVLGREGELIFDDDFDWASLQAAPAEQAVEGLRGDEWIAVRGLHPQRHEISTRLPGHHAVARLFGAPAPLPNEPVPLRLDSIRVAAHRMALSLSWRAHWPLPGNLPHGMRVVFGAAPFGHVPALSEASSDEEDWSALRATRPLTDDDLARMAAAVPSFVDGSVDEATAVDLMRGTVTLDDRQLEAIESAFTSAPFVIARDKPAAASIPGAPWSKEKAPVVIAPKPHATTLAADSVVDEVAAVRALLDRRDAERQAQEALRQERLEELRREEALVEARRLEEERAVAKRREEEHLREARREAEARRFAEEQERARLEERRRLEEEAERRKKAAAEVRSNIYGGFDRKR